MVYCGPSIPGVAKQYTAYTNGIPTALAEAIVKQPAMEGLVVPLEQLPEAMKNLRSGTGHISLLFEWEAMGYSARSIAAKKLLSFR